MLEKALEYFRKLEDVVFVLEYDNGESHEDNWTSISKQGYRSIDELIKEESKGDVIVEVYQSQGGQYQEIEEGEHYTITFLPDKNSKKIKSLRKRYEKLENEIRGDGGVEFKKLSEKEQNKKGIDTTKWEVNFSISNMTIPVTR